MSTYLSPAQAERVVTRFNQSFQDFTECMEAGLEFLVSVTSAGNACYICQNLNSLNDADKFFYILNI